MKRSLFLFTFVLPFLAGCDDVSIAPVSGKVTRNGQPVANAALTFQPETGRQSWGMTDSNGNFKLIYSHDERSGKDTEGALIGKHRVTVEFPPTDVHGSVAEDHKQILKKYGKNGSETLNIDVTKKMAPLEIKLD